MTKKIAGYSFIVISIFLVIAIPFMLPELLRSGFGILAFLTGGSKFVDSLKAFGFFSLWLIHVSLTAVLWNQGRKLIRRPKKTIKATGDLFQ